MNKNFAAVSIFIAISAAALGQQFTIGTTLKIAEPGTKGWHRSKADPVAIAKKVDSQVHAQRAVRQDVVVLYDGPQGKGQSLNAVKILDARTFAVPYPNLDVSEPFGGEIRADGTYFAIFGPKQWSRPAPLIGVPINQTSPAQTVRSWPMTFPRMMYTSLLFHADIWTTLVRGLVSKIDGYNPIVEERVMKVHGIKVHNYRILARRDAAWAKKLGPAVIELVFDRDMYLPVTVRVHFKKLKDKKLTQLLWQSIWKFNQKFTAADFQIPTRGR